MITIKAKIEAETLDDLKYACEELIVAIENRNRTGCHSHGNHWMIDYEQNLEERLKQEPI